MKNPLKKIKRLKSLQKSIFRTHASIYDGAFLWIYFYIFAI